MVSWFYFLVRNLSLFCSLANDFSIYAFRVRSRKLGSPSSKLVRKWVSRFHFLVKNLIVLFSSLMIFPLMLLGPDLVTQKIGLLELKVGQKMGSWFKFLVRNLSLSLSLSNYFPFMRLGPGLVPLKLGLPNSKFVKKQGSCLVSVSSMYLSFVFLLTKRNIFIREAFLPLGKAKNRLCFPFLISCV